VQSNSTIFSPKLIIFKLKKGLIVQSVRQR
jgi:hypothetical protein